MQTGVAHGGDATASGRLRARQLLHDARRLLTRRVVHLIGFVVFTYLFLKVIPGLEKALESLKGVSAAWIVGAMAVETLSQSGYVVSWRGILDPDDLLGAEGRGRHLAARVAWAQLGGGMIVPGGTLGSMGIGAWMLQRLGMPMGRVGERQFTLMFLNTAIDGLAVMFFGLGLATGVFEGGNNLLLTLLPAVVVACGLSLALVVARSTERLVPKIRGRNARLARAVSSLALAVENTKKMLRSRGSTKIVVGAVAYLGFDMLVLQGAFLAIDAHPVPTFAVVSMGYLIGGLGGSIPLPANLGAVTGMAAMLIAFGVDHSDAIAAVVLYQAIGFLVPLLGGGIAYVFLRGQLGAASVSSPTAQPRT